MLVSLDGERYLADVGIGSAAPRTPLLLKEGVVQDSCGEKYLFERDPDFGWMLYEMRGGEWARYFSFAEEYYFDADYIPTMFYCEKHPDSKFNKSLMVMMKTDGGRLVIDGNSYKEFVGAELSYLREGLSDGEINSLLKEKFGICIYE